MQARCRSATCCSTLAEECCLAAVEALYTAFLYLAQRHVLLRSRFNLLDEEGPKLKMRQLKKFRLPFSYTDLQ